MAEGKGPKNRRLLALKCTVPCHRVANLTAIVGSAAAAKYHAAKLTAITIGSVRMPSTATVKRRHGAPRPRRPPSSPYPPLAPLPLGRPPPPTDPQCAAPPPPRQWPPPRRLAASCCAVSFHPAVVSFQDPKAIKMRHHAFHLHQSGSTTLSASTVLLPPGSLAEPPPLLDLICEAHGHTEAIVLMC